MWSRTITRSRVCSQKLPPPARRSDQAFHSDSLRSPDSPCPIGPPCGMNSRSLLPSNTHVDDHVRTTQVWRAVPYAVIRAVLALTEGFRRYERSSSSKGVKHSTEQLRKPRYGAQLWSPSVKDGAFATRSRETTRPTGASAKGRSAAVRTPQGRERDWHSLNSCSSHATHARFW